MKKRILALVMTLAMCLSLLPVSALATGDGADGKYEIWTKMLPIRDWAAFEKEWSNANSAAGGEVVK